ncbi:MULTISPECIES: fimbrial protein [unclassified Serratia (in: enterobacteria)]|uniref:fimbrial protein n=1 Tax=unclassified Serratia (in: enterobacteria) TaxID=2647522 RepID=UPI0018A92B82|nr:MULTISPECIES: fimbrial protein [unclassified Serratia (in: enterobacteria)]
MSSNIQKTIKKAVTQKTSRARLAALSLGALALAVLGISQGYAVTTVCNVPPPLSLTFPALVFDGGADGPTIGQPIGSGWGAVTTNPTLFSGGADCLITNGVTLLMMGAETQPIPGITYTESGITYPVFPTNVPGIGIIIGIKATSAANYTPVNILTIFFPEPSPSRGMGVSLQAKLIVTGRLTTGVYQIPRQDLVRVYGSGYLPETATGISVMSLNTTTVTITARTCQMTSATTQNVPLPRVTKNQFSGPGSLSAVGYNFTLSTLCDSGVKLYATMTDANDPSNTGNTLSLGTGSTASGVGVQILRNNQAIAFGPDSAASGNTNQWFIGTAGSGGKETINIPLEAKYVQTESNMVAGNIRSRATVTFSYQ